MLYVFWSLLNGLIFLYFLYLVFGFIAVGKRIFKPQLKTVSIILLCIGIVQIISASDNDEENNTIQINEKVNGQSDSRLKSIILEDNLTMDINLTIRYTADEDLLVPTASNSFLTGFVWGYAWEFKAIQTDSHQPNEPVAYSANGILKWHLFGFHVYSESKSFSGIIK